ncbi:MAG TPA: site-2 protease family protein [Candidatus Acidoferrales bacterium]|nr:site-2 protease family protein [Candidatus Acidoferrales bacterium]
MDFSAHTITLGFLWYIAFLFSTVCHEGAHALAGKLGGDPTAYEAGQVSLNPVPHIRREPFGLVLVPLLSYVWQGWMMGWASAPYDPMWQRRHPRRAAWMALAGPGTNFTLMVLAGVGMRLGLWSGIFQIPSRTTFTTLVVATDPERLGFLATLCSIFFMLNLILMTFNLLPVPPLDGSTGIAVFLPEETALKLMDFYSQSGMAFAGIVVAWIGYGYLFRWLAPIAVHLLFYNL